MDYMEEENPDELEIPMVEESPDGYFEENAPETIQFKFNGRDEAINIVNTGGDLVEYLTNNQEACPLIGKEIKFIKVLSVLLLG